MRNLPISSRHGQQSLTISRWNCKLTRSRISRPCCYWCQNANFEVCHTRINTSSECRPKYPSGCFRAAAGFWIFWKGEWNRKRTPTKFFRPRSCAASSGAGTARRGEFCSVVLSPAAQCSRRSLPEKGFSGTGCRRMGQEPARDARLERKQLDRAEPLPVHCSHHS